MCLQSTDGSRAAVKYDVLTPSEFAQACGIDISGEEEEGML